MTKVYVLLNPDNMNAQNAENYHVIEAWYDTDTDSLSFKDGYTALDGMYEMKRHPSIKHSQILPHDEDSLRLELARRQNRGDKICGNCVRNLYADGDHE